MITTTLAAAMAAQTFTLTILHTNDIHAHVEPTAIRGKTYGGYARAATLIRRYRATDPNPIVLNAGDTFQGTLYYNVYKGLADAHLMNLTGYNAMALGNHEFDDGPAGLLPFAQSTSFPLLCANMDFTGEPFLKNWIKPSTVLTIGGQRIGLIGLMTPDLFEISSPGERLKMIDIDQALSSEVNKLKSQGVNKIIAVTHIGYSTDIALAKRHPDVDVFVGGHSHSLLCETGAIPIANPAGGYPTKVGNTLVVQAWEWNKVLGRLKIVFDAAGNIKSVLDAKPILVDEAVPEDHAVKSAVDAFKKPIDNLGKEVVGETKGGLTRDTGPEMKMGNVIADAMLAYTVRNQTVAAFMNRGGVRSHIEPGPITYGEIIAAQPFGNTLVVLEATGTEIRDMLAVGATKAGTVQVSKGFAYKIGAGGSITSMTLNGNQMVDNAKYRIVVNNFMARGGDGFTSLAEAKGYRVDTGLLDSEALIEYIKKNSPIDTPIEGRVTSSR
ncbi:MAG: 5'-nucleotidase C-terminal domain-containing protein [Chthonomonas sp.]|nr:5'-nucleotidase C-terminal domain-containing protein [Chthonomonas sp.]